MDVRSTGYMID